ncbi:MAG: CPBP family intramembrane glutamic endopeptidase [Deltaproteobacteria bacterium]
MRLAIGDSLRRHPALSYFALTFAISWGGIILIIGPGGILGTKEDFERLFPICVPVLVLGPSLASICLTGLTAGRPGLRELRSRMLEWRVGGRWYAAAILTAPLYFTVTSLALSAFSPEFLPGVFTADDKVGLVLRGLAVALVAGVVEEVGWTGFAVPTLRRRYGPVATGLVVGILWGVWHFLPKIWGAAAFGLAAWMPADLLSAVVGLTGYRILMVRVYDRTGSLLVAMLMHMGATASTLILQPLVTGAPLVKVGLALAAAPWIIVAAVAAADHLRRPLGGSGSAPAKALHDRLDVQRRGVQRG